MTVLVTGGAGFIGSRLVSRHLAAGDRVLVLDDLSTGRLENLAVHRGHPDLEIIAGSACDADLVSQLVERSDRIYHLAAAVGVRLVLADPVRAMETNNRSQEVVFRAAAERNRRLIFASSSEVYGRSPDAPFREDLPLELGPTRVGRWSYAASKLNGEWLALSWFERTGFAVTIARLFNTVGPGQRSNFGMVLPNLAEAAVRGESLPVHGDGLQTRCFAHVDDTTEALFRLMATPAAVGQVVNVGSDREVSILELARRVRELAQSESTIDLIPYRDAYGPGFEDMTRRVPALDKLERLTGFRARIGLDAIIRETLAAVRGIEESGVADKI